MSCCYLLDDAESFKQDLDYMMSNSEYCPSLLKENSKMSQQSHKSLYSQSDLIKLQRGGCIIPTKIGNIQFGLPPETIKDCLALGLDVPLYYIIPSKRFDKRLGISTAEFEFPAYFNFFCRNKQIQLICTKEAEAAIRAIFQETLLGPLDYGDLELDFHKSFPREGYPDFNKERSVFSKNPKNLNEKLTIDHLLAFIIFDENNVAMIKENDVEIKIIKKQGEFGIVENGQYLKTIQDKVEFPEEYYDYIVIKPEDFRSESLKHIKNRRSTQQEQSPTLKMLNSLPEDTWQDKMERMNTLQQIEPEQFERGANRKPSMTYWNAYAGQVQTGSMIMDEILEEQEHSFTPPDFGVTVLGCSHGFDPKGSVSGYIFWVYGRGIMVDPPPFASYHLKQMGIPTILISAVIISHCHADHDSGTFHKILDDIKVEIITTRTIMNSFLRKYGAMFDMNVDQLKTLFIFRPVIIGIPINIYGAQFTFSYAMHTIPSLAFSVQVENKSIYFSSDTFYDPEQLLKYHEQGILSQKRYEDLAFVKFKEDIILHEAGVPPIHTSQEVLGRLPANVKNRLYLVHSASKDLKKNFGLRIAKTGIENTMILIPSNTNKHIQIIRRLDLLSAIDIFENLTLKNVRWLLDALIIEEHKAGEIVVKAGSLGDRFYIIESGLARIYSDTKGQEFERYYQVGDYFGESAIIQHDGRRGANVMAVTKLKLLILEKHDFWFIFGDGIGGQGPIIQKMKALTLARKSKAILCIFKNQLLSELTPAQKTQLEMIMKEQEIQKGTILWKVGDKPEFVFLIKKGTFAFIDCPEEDVDELDSGAFVGELKVMRDNTPLTTSIRATRKSIIFKISRREFLNFIKKNPGIYMLLQDIKYIE